MSALRPFRSRLMPGRDAPCHADLEIVSGGAVRVALPRTLAAGAEERHVGAAPVGAVKVRDRRFGVRSTWQVWSLVRR